MSVPAYPAYQESGIEWIGDVPLGWKILPIMAVASEVAQRNVGLVNTNLLSLSYGRIVLKDITSNDGLLPETFETYQVLDPDDIVLRLTDLQNDKRSLRTARCADAGIITSAYLALRPRSVESGFLAHLLHSYDIMKVFYSMGGGLRQTMNFADVRRLPVLVPPRDEQLAITAFLDRETGKIDALVAEQERLISLLKEKRQSVVYGAMTNGVEPAARTKPSGVGTPARVPEHWEVLPLTRVVRQFVDYRGSTPNKIDDGIPLITATQIKEGRIDHTLDPVFISEAEYASRMTRGLPAVGDVLLTTEAPLGEVAQIEDTRVAPGQRMILLKADETKIRNDFLFWHFRSDFGRKELWIRASGSTASGIRSDRLRASAVLVPPLDEQDRIVAFIRDALAKFAGVEAEVRTQISLLQERRAALISAAVTGKIDLRGLVSPAEAQAV